MSCFSVPEMKLYKRRMVSNIIRDIQQQKQEDVKKWEMTLQAVKNFDDDMTLDNFDILALCKGSRTPVHIGEKIKFAILAEDYLRKHLQLALVDDMTVSEQADIHHELWKKNQEMRKLDYPRTLDIQASFRDVTNFTKLGENKYVVSISHQFIILRLPIKKCPFLAQPGSDDGRKTENSGKKSQSYERGQETLGCCMWYGSKSKYPLFLYFPYIKNKVDTKPLIPFF